MGSCCGVASTATVDIGVCPPPNTLDNLPHLTEAIQDSQTVPLPGACVFSSFGTVREAVAI